MARHSTDMTATKAIPGILALLLCLCMALCLALSTVYPTHAASPDADAPADAAARSLEKGHPKLQSALYELAATQESRRAGLAAERGIHFSDGMVRVIAEASDEEAQEAAVAVEALGGTVETTYRGLVQAMVPVSSLTSLADEPCVRLVRLPWVAVPAATSEGAGVINADDWNAAGYTGSGIKVGVLDGGFSGYDALLGTDLPAAVNTLWAPSIGGEGGSIHGTACAEIIYDIAPDADFYLANFATEAEMGNAVDWFIAQGVDVVSCSMGIPNSGPGDGTGPICAMVDEARAAGILWCNSAGNFAERHWMGYWTDADADDLHEFAPGVELNAFTATAGELIVVCLKWDDPFGGSGNDYDLYLLDSGYNIIPPTSQDYQTGSQDPVESIVTTASYSGVYYVQFWLFDADGTAHFHLISAYHELQYRVSAGSLIEPADAASAFTLGAVDQATPNALEDFSSRGPTQDGRVKPDAVTPDGVSTESYGPVAFYGTSAAAPHAAGAAVLVKDAHPGYTPDDLQAFLETTAVDLGAAGKDNLYGSGRLDLASPPASPSPPTVATNPATDVAESGGQLTATLHGTITDDGSDECSYQFEYGTQSGGPYDVATGWTGTEFTGDTFSATTGPLDQDTAYFFRARAQNDSGIGNGEERTFTTPTLFSVTLDADPDEVGLTIDGTAYSADQLPVEFSWADGSEHQCAAPSTVEVDDTTQYVFVQWSDSDTEPASRTITVSADAEYTATCKKQYYLAVESDYGEPTGGGWYDDGVSADIEVDEVVEEDSTRYMFSDWVVDGEEEDADNTVYQLNYCQVIQRMEPGEPLPETLFELPGPPGPGLIDEY